MEGVPHQELAGADLDGAAAQAGDVIDGGLEDHIVGAGKHGG
ncbi:MAG: hypothetical protein V9G14_05555 [Cypionkella sp.]